MKEGLCCGRNGEKRICFCTNTKMAKGFWETLSYIKKLVGYMDDFDQKNIELTVMPSYTVLDAARKIIPQGRILLGAQNVCEGQPGEYTGEISPAMLHELGVDLVLIGHSDRRFRLKETDEQINRKIREALKQGMEVLFSISETGADREFQASDEILRIQIKRGLDQVPAEELSHMRILYEPAWAIGDCGQPACAEYVQERHRAIRQCLIELYGVESALEVPLIYGGSVNMENACSFMARQDVDGLGIGRSAWDAENFRRIISSVLRMKQEGEITYAENFK